MSAERYDAAVRWFQLGYGLLPCDPGIKKLIKGYGPHQKQITNLSDIEFWFEDREANMAVAGGEGKIILDFDDPDLYKSWAKKYPVVKTTYTERTPGSGGYHLWFHGDIPQGVKWRAGVEHVPFVMVYPSVVDGKQYAAGKGEIIAVQDMMGIFSDLSEPGFSTPYVLTVNQSRQQNKKPERIISVLDRIKQHYGIVDMIREISPELCHRLSRSGSRYLVGNCPLHADHGKHFYIDTKLNLYGCHKCGAHGDTINLYAALKGIDNHEAIEQLKGRVA
jgi:hypothetical protein